MSAEASEAKGENPARLAGAFYHRQRRQPRESTMKRFFAVLTVLSLVFGTAAFAVPASAATSLHAPSDNGGGANS